MKIEKNKVGNQAEVWFAPDSGSDIDLMVYSSCVVRYISSALLL
jgi:hypothetical protein